MARIIRSAMLASEPRSLYPQAMIDVAAAGSGSPQADGSADRAAAEASRIPELEHQLAEVERERVRLQLELDRWRDDEAERTAQALRDATERGYADGQLRAESDASEALHQLTMQVNALLGSLREQQAQRARECEDVLVTIAFEAVCKLLGDKAAEADGIRQLVHQAIGELSDRDELRIRLHPDDVALLNEATAGQPGGLVLVPDSAVRIGGCMIENGSGTLDARLETQLARLAAVFSDTRKARHAHGGAAA